MYSELIVNSAVALSLALSLARSLALCYILAAVRPPFFSSLNSQQSNGIIAAVKNDNTSKIVISIN